MRKVVILLLLVALLALSTGVVDAGYGFGDPGCGNAANTEHGGGAAQANAACEDGITPPGVHNSRGNTRG